jgi:hypothetical protein
MLPIFGTLDGNIVPGSIAEAAVYGEHPTEFIASGVPMAERAAATRWWPTSCPVMIFAFQNMQLIYGK